MVSLFGGGLGMREREGEGVVYIYMRGACGQAHTRREGSLLWGDWAFGRADGDRTWSIHYSRDARALA